MYEVTIYNGIEDEEGTLIHSPYVNNLKAKFKVTQRLQGISSMNITINMMNPAWNKIKPITTLIKVVNIKTGKTEFDGRILMPTEQLNSDGLASIKYECESKLAYLNDSTQRYAKIQNTTIKDFFIHLINVHNEQVEPHKRFKVGNVTVTNNTDNVYRYVGYGKTFAEIKDNLIDRLGGFLVLREESDGTYLDYLAEVGEVKDTPIQLRTNLSDMKRDIDPTEIITRVVPLGAREETPEGETQDASTPRLTIESVNNGIDYLEDASLIEEFGVIEGSITYDDVHQPSILKLRGEQFFQNQRAAKVTYDVTPLNLSLIDTTFEEFEVGNHHPLINPLFEIEETLQIIEKEIDSESPQRDKLSFGEKYRTLTQYQADFNKKTRKITELEDTVVRQSERMASIQSELNNVNNAVQQINIELEEGNIPALSEAVSNLNSAVNDLTDAVNAIPDYDVATETENGLMSFEDKAKLNLIQVLNAVDLDALKQKLDLITITTPTNIDTLVQRVEELENATNN